MVISITVDVNYASKQLSQITLGINIDNQRNNNNR